jgi:hypothetical protein
MTNQPSAERRPVVGWEGFYEVSSDGRVFSLDRVVKTGRGPGIRKAKELRINPNTKGYASVSLCVNYKQVYRRVHRLVAEAFIENPHGYPEVNHKNANRMDARVENLEWCTSSQNKLHAFYVTRSLTIKPRCKLSYEIAEEIRMQYPSANMTELSKKYGVSHTAISNIVHRIAWQNAPQQDAP